MSFNVTLNGRDNLTTTYAYGTIGTTAVNVLAASPAPTISSNTIRSFLEIHCPSATASVAVTFDGTTPVVNGAGYTIGPLGTRTYDAKIPQGTITIIGSTSGVPYTITTA